MNKPKTIECWEFYVDYGQGWEYEITEYDLEGMNENKKAYQENCRYPLKIVKTREQIVKEVQK